MLPHTQRDGSDSWQLVGGGPPLQDAELPKTIADQGWRMPKPLREFYAVHSGFGRHYYDNPFGWSHILVPCSELRLLSESVDTLAEGADYDGRNLLEFYPDGAGNAQCFRRLPDDDDDRWTCDWDHETRQLSEEVEFFEFLDERLLRLAEE